jgi:SMC interacting uncharacterized protein involved in chromosome segregation
MSEPMTFNYGTHLVVIKMDFEALGRYHAAKEQAEKLNAERHKLLNELERLAAEARGMAHEMPVRRFKPTRAQELVSQIETIEASLIDAITEANRCAEIAEKPKLKALFMS